MLSKGKFWSLFWGIAFVILFLWGIGTFLWWRESIVNLNALSIAALWLSCGAGFQSTLAMRKSDPKDDF